MKRVLTTIEKHKLAILPDLQKRVEVWLFKWASDIMSANPNGYKNEEYRKLTEVAQAVLNNPGHYVPSVCKTVAFVGTIDYKIDSDTELISYDGVTEDNDIQFSVNSIMPAICGVTNKNKQ